MVRTSSAPSPAVNSRSASAPAAASGSPSESVVFDSIVVVTVVASVRLVAFMTEAPAHGWHRQRCPGEIVVMERQFRRMGPGPAFVGRGVELMELEGFVERAVTGRGGLALIVGEPGVGKTTLAEA